MLNVAPQIIKSTVRAVLSQEEVIKKASSAYLDDVYINEDVIPTSRVAEYLALPSLMMNDPEHLTDGDRVLGLTVWVKMAYCSGNGGNILPSVPEVITRRKVTDIFRCEDGYV